jgi:hypothetical protein
MMRNRVGLWMMVLLIAVVSTATLADNVKDAEGVLCTAVQATVCYMDGDCEIGAPWHWNIPQFIEIDFKQKVLRTTQASEEHRQTPFKNFERAEGLIFLQGVERGRAFSLTIDENTGLASIAVAKNGETVSVFGACTPLLSPK